MTPPATPRIGIAGLAGRMGCLLEQEVARLGLTLAGGTLGQSASGLEPHTLIKAGMAELAAASDVVIDFTRAATVRTHAVALAQHGTGWVLGTSGLDATDEDAVQAAASRIPIVYAPNFAPGVTLVLALAERMAAALPAETYDAEILEMHHRQKADAPSGTALGLGRAVAAGRNVDLNAVMESGRHGHTGPRTDNAIGFAVQRGGQIVGDHSLSFTSAEEQITLAHRAFDRRVFANGAVRAALWLNGRAPGLYTMRDVLEV